MEIGVVKDLKQGEARVGMTPENVKILVEAGHTLYVENNAGFGAGFPNEQYIAAGAKIVEREEAWEAEMMVRVKEPLEEEYQYLKEGQIIWGFLHLPANKACVEKMIEMKVTAFSAENIATEGTFPLLKPLSAIAGRRAVNIGQYYLEKQHGGQGILLPGIPESGIEAGHIVIFGGGTAAENAADIALSIGCSVLILELSDTRIQELETRYAGKKLQVVKSTTEALEEHIKKADVFISTILIPGAKPPKLVKEYMVKSMKPGAVIVDIAIDQGGTVETIDHATNHAEPVFTRHNVIHYAVPNMPGATPRTSTLVMSKGNIEYLKQIADNGLEEALNLSESLRSGMSIYKGKIVSPALADSIGLPYTKIK
ncbi:MULTISPECIES: alanine dehydrogenase [Lactococcus]|uniref:Alanine dehydrogenase n=1 Tax=Lactococcus petauri TaxID=1940789 RepID=A0AAJ2IYB7_9LACT|nr:MULTISPECIES: alanine dehydrogenase [Lactococcus]MCH1712157.1 alanine dehydrogenase [Lactococcus petauri]MDT2526667.1 alanine dehydrogenase [Lactococcus petauri]MDT2541172.1 alanine dehydrogenase [Lactococcus petauri]MDT2557747.1 alanine dehydrogenase [Lactococcus petauri]MDT2559920.1 alanine dehydrogenase [Lactococcus petauri]